MNSKVLVFGDSHVKKMSRYSDCLDFFGVSGMNASSWVRYKDVLQKYQTVILQVGGNDVSQHPRRKDDPIEHIAETKQVLKQCIDWCKENGRKTYIMTIINRKSAKAGIDLLNGRMKKTFKNYAIADLPDTELSQDNVHLTPDGYVKLAHYLEEFVRKL